MTNNLVSYFNIFDSLVSGPVPISPFTPNNANLFPKLPDRINETAWELWFFDGVSSNGSTGITISFFRDAQAPKLGFRVQVNAIWPDGAQWGTELYFAESIITAEDVHGTKGIWRSGDDNLANFEVASDLQSATLTFDVQFRLKGTMNLTTLPPSVSLPATEEEAMLGPQVHYVRPIATASITADLTFFTTDKATNKTSSRDFRIEPLDQATGGMDRFWTPLAWPQLMTESYFLRATVGEYKVHFMRIFGTVAAGEVPYVSARLYHQGRLVCAPQSAGQSEEDYAAIEKQQGEGLTGQFRDKNTGYVIKFVSPELEGCRKSWSFNVTHDRAWWNTPTSAPGPNGTGNSGFVEKVSGGEEGGEEFEGYGGGGQAQLA